ncbi:hypothetical protein HDV57DRAFT_73390 [Trichoderma longibrachiatum]|uniref:Uncharacterized protein n=1 Tax=Trichoderma longibrachiatum ATCC 18648 TaxID=983965 RepID=A0A2T4BUR0_TRILO|nr:hypothetical protein M440DRAFT_1071089 [Trichoderma longibrachiatum ATCC 18648]
MCRWGRSTGQPDRAADSSDPCLRPVIVLPVSVRSTAASREYRANLQRKWQRLALACHSIRCLAREQEARAERGKQQAEWRLESAKDCYWPVSSPHLPLFGTVFPVFFIAAVSLHRRALSCTLVGLAQRGQMLEQRRRVQVARGSIARSISGIHVD